MPEKYLEIVDALIKQGIEKSSAYAIAVNQYKKKYGRKPDIKNSEENNSNRELSITIKDECFTDFFKKNVEEKLSESLKPEKVNLLWENDFVDFDSPLISFKPMSPGKVIYNLNDPFDFENKKYVIEKKQNGLKATIHKKGNLVKIFSDDEREITSSFQIIVEEAKKIDVKGIDFILDGDIICYENKECLGVTPINNTINNPNYVNDSNMLFFVSDMIYNGKDISNLSLLDRKKNLKMLEFSNHIRYVPFVVVSNKEDFERGTNLFSKMNGSEGCIIKDSEGKYLKDSKSQDVVFLSNLKKIDVVVTDIIKKGEAYNYSFALFSTNDSVRNKIKINNMDAVVIGSGAAWDCACFAIGEFATILLSDVKRIRHSDSSFDYDIVCERILKKNKEQTTSNLSELEDLVYLKGNYVSD